MFAYIIKDGEHLFITIISIDIFEPVLSYGPVQMYHKFQKHNLSVKLGSIAAILDYVGEHLCENLSIDLIADQFYISKYYMMRLFKQETGYTLGQYISQKRLLLAKELLSTGAPGTQVCYDCGFKDYSTFSRAYKQLFGVTPSGRTCP